MKIKILIIISFTLLVFNACKDEPPPTIIVPKSDETYAPEKVKVMLDKWQKNTFDYFYKGVSPVGMSYERIPNDGVVTIGGSGMGVMAMIVGVERGFVTKDAALAQMQKLVRFLGKIPRYHGVWSHWYNLDGTNHPFGEDVQAGDIVETSLMMQGLLTAYEYYNGAAPIEQEIRDSINSFWNKIDWRFYTNNNNTLYWIWQSTDNTFKAPFGGWNETWITYLLAMAAPSPHNISKAVYDGGWRRSGAYFAPNRTTYGYKLPYSDDAYGGPLFFTHYSYLGLNPSLLQDDQVYYWQQCTAQTMINRHYCIYEAPTRYRYDVFNWGLTACAGARSGSGYKARSPSNDDGVIAPTAALSSFPYTPFYSTQVLKKLSETSSVQGTQGFWDSYCPETFEVAREHLCIDQGPIVVMMENYRSGLIWNLLMKNEHIKNALKLAGVKDSPTFTQGFLRVMPDTKNGEYDLMRHPDRGKFELSFYSNSAGNTHFKAANADDATKIPLDTTINTVQGENLFTFDNAKILKGYLYNLTMTTPDNQAYNLKIRLR